MGKREQLCLQMRNKDDKYDETYCRHYIKSKRGYMFFLFFKFQTVSIFIMWLIMSVVSWKLSLSREDEFFKLIPYALAAIFGFAWIFMIFKGLWYWKYDRHVFVTNEGIWIMTCSAFWWRGAPDFTGKRRFLAPSWSLYSWSELKKISANRTDAPRSVSKIANFFKDFDNFIIRSTKLTTIYLTRWDGVEQVNFLKNADAEELLEYAKTQKRQRRKKKSKETEPVEEDTEEPADDILDE